MPRGRYKKYLTHNVSEPDTPIIVSRQTRLSQSQQVNISRVEGINSESNDDYRDIFINDPVEEENDTFQHNNNSGVEEDDIYTDDVDLPEDDETFQTPVNTRNKPLYEGCKISLGESELLLLMFSLRHKLTARALDDLIDLVNCHTPCIVHQSKYYLLKQYKNDPPKQHFFCENCHGLLDEMNTLNTQIECPHCSKDNNMKSLQESLSYFLTFPLKDQIKNLLETNIGTKLCWDYSDDGSINDVISGTMYTKLTVKYNTTKWISLQWNTDGIQDFKSSKISVWPIQVMINELSYNDRRENILLVGLWYSTTKPDMNTFLDPFTKELCDLQNNGIDFIQPSSKLLTNIKVHSIISSVDSVARPMIQNIKQFNGKFGCPFCLNEGAIRNVGRDQSRMYIGGLGHSVLLGVVKSFVEAWYNSSNSTCVWYLGRKVREFGARLLNTKPPHEVTRISVHHGVFKIENNGKLQNGVLFYYIPLQFVSRDYCLRDIINIGIT
ncbi:hypothetical protein ACI65C_006598 [Semiaphis heraclei]